MKSHLEVTAPQGDPVAWSFDLLQTFPAFARIPDVARLEKGAPAGGAVPLSALLPDDGRAGANTLRVELRDGSTADLPLASVEETAIVLFELRGRALPPEDGGPFRLFIPAATTIGPAVAPHAHLKGVAALRLLKT